MVGVTVRGRINSVRVGSCVSWLMFCGSQQQHVDMQIQRCDGSWTAVGNVLHGHFLSRCTVR